MLELLPIFLKYTAPKTERRTIHGDGPTYSETGDVRYKRRWLQVVELLPWVKRRSDMISTNNRRV